MTLNPNWYLNATGQFQQIGSGQIGISTTTTTGFLTYLTATNASSITISSAAYVPLLALTQGSSGTWFVEGTASFLTSAASNLFLSISATSTTGAGFQTFSRSFNPTPAAYVSMGTQGIVTSPSGGITLFGGVIFGTLQNGYIDPALSNLTAIRIG